jgi:glycosyltransferase involved in cell wall biosynthesis
VEAANKISIIMPTYNRAGLIAETIDSIRKQTYSNWELLIMDDGSTDETALIVQSFNDARISFYKHVHTGEVSKLKNEGIRYARSELIAFMDSDDLWPPEKLKKQMQALLYYPDAGFSVTNGYTFKNDLSKPIDFFYRQTSGMEYGPMFDRFCNARLTGYTQVLMFRKHCIDTVDYFPEHRLYTDLSFIGNLAYHFKAVLLYEPLMMRRLHNSNITSSDQDYMNAEFFEVMAEFRDKKMLSASVFNDTVFKAYVHFGEECILRGLRFKAISKFMYAWKYKPFSIIPLKKIGKTFVSLLR